MDNNIINDDLFQVLYIWGERGLDQLQNYSNESFFDILKKLEGYLDRKLINVSKGGSSPEFPIYVVKKDKIPKEIKLRIENQIKETIKQKMGEISNLIENNPLNAYKMLSFIEKKWNLYKVRDLLPYYIDLKQNLNSKIKNELK